MEDHAGKEAILFQAFKQRLGSCSKPNMKFNLSSLLRQQVYFDSLTTPFTHDEIDVVVKDLPPDKAPGPDGFSGIFLKTCWHIIKHDFYQLCHDLRAEELNLESINTGFIILILKIHSPQTANDFAPSHC